MLDTWQLFGYIRPFILQLTLPLHNKHAGFLKSALWIFRWHTWLLFLAVYLSYTCACVGCILLAVLFVCAHTPFDEMMWCWFSSVLHYVDVYSGPVNLYMFYAAMRPFCQYPVIPCGAGLVHCHLFSLVLGCWVCVELWFESQLVSVVAYVGTNPLTPNDHYSGRTATLTSKRCTLYIYSTNIGTEYFKHGIFSSFFSLQNAVCFIILTYLVPVLFTFYIQMC